MVTVNSSGVVVFHRIVIKPETLQEVDVLPLVTISRSDIVNVRLTRGLLTERPLIMCIAGILVAALGLAGLSILVAAFGPGPNRLPKTGTGLAMGLLFGP